MSLIPFGMPGPLTPYTFTELDQACTALATACETSGGNPVPVRFMAQLPTGWAQIEGTVTLNSSKNSFVLSSPSYSALYWPENNVPIAQVTAQDNEGVWHNTTNQAVKAIMASTMALNQATSAAANDLELLRATQRETNNKELETLASIRADNEKKQLEVESQRRNLETLWEQAKVANEQKQAELSAQAAEIEQKINEENATLESRMKEVMLLEEKQRQKAADREAFFKKREQALKNKEDELFKQKVQQAAALFSANPEQVNPSSRFSQRMSSEPQQRTNASAAQHISFLQPHTTHDHQRGQQREEPLQKDYVLPANNNNDLLKELISLLKKKKKSKNGIYEDSSSDDDEDTLYVDTSDPNSVAKFLNKKSKNVAMVLPEDAYKYPDAFLRRDISQKFPQAFRNLWQSLRPPSPSDLIESTAFEQAVTTMEALIEIRDPTNPLALYHNNRIYNIQINTALTNLLLVFASNKEERMREIVKQNAKMREKLARAGKKYPFPDMSWVEELLHSFRVATTTKQEGVRR